MPKKREVRGCVFFRSTYGSWGFSFKKNGNNFVKTFPTKTMAERCRLFVFKCLDEKEQAELASRKKTLEDFGFYFTNPKQLLKIPANKKDLKCKDAKTVEKELKKDLKEAFKLAENKAFVLGEGEANGQPKGLKDLKIKRIKDKNKFICFSKKNEKLDFSEKNKRRELYAMF